MARLLWALDDEVAGLLAWRGRLGPDTRIGWDQHLGGWANSGGSGYRTIALAPVQRCSQCDQSTERPVRIGPARPDRKSGESQALPVRARGR